MKKIFLVAVLSFSVILTGTVLAEEKQEPKMNLLAYEVSLEKLPNPGILPGSFWYFLDNWGERIQEVFISKPEDKALFQSKRALERIAEVKALLEEKGVDAPGLDVAEEKIQQNIEKANEILEKKQARGEEVSELAKRLETDFNIRRKLLNQVFDIQRYTRKNYANAIKEKIKEAREQENFDEVSRLRSILNDVRVERERLTERKNIFQDSILSKNDIIRQKIREEDRKLRALKQEKEILEEEGEKVVETLFEEREIVIENQEEILEIQLNKAILAGDREAVEQIRSQLAEVEFQAEVLEIEEEKFEEKIETEVDELETAIEIILETRDDQDELKIMANKALRAGKEAKAKALAKANEQNIQQNPVIIGLIKQAEQFNERALSLFEQEEYKRSYLTSKKTMDFANKAFKLITVKENLRKERPDLPIPDDIVLPIEPRFFNEDTPPEIIDPQKISLEKIKYQIKTAEQIIERTRMLTEHEDVGDIVFPVVVELIEKAENNIDKAEVLLKEESFRSALRHAKKAKAMAEKAYKIMQQKLQTGEIKITPDPIKKRETREEEYDLFCETDADCKHLICPMVIGSDTPQCNKETGKCFCGPGQRIKKLDNNQIR